VRFAAIARLRGIWPMRWLCETFGLSCGALLRGRGTHGSDPLVSKNSNDTTGDENACWSITHDGGSPVYSTAMSQPYRPLQLLLLMFAGWVNRHQLDVIEYLQEENRVLKDRLGRRRIRFTDADRRRLARKARALGRKVLNELQTLVTPDTLLRWYREMLAFKWNYSHRRSPGRTSRHEHYRRPYCAPGAGESILGLYANPRRDCQPWT
jgi:hypothetical protein